MNANVSFKRANSQEILSGLIAEDQTENEIFAAILAMSRRADLPIRDLFMESMRFLYPGCDAKRVQAEVCRYEEYLENPPRGEDEFGNPRWISLIREDKEEQADGDRRWAGQPPSALKGWLLRIVGRRS
ncbi:MAG: hypothetical protein LBN33_11460 [Desulfovibrio sp.]|nr:hypothetical protein [Desulfovibrio sp.]